MNEEQGKKGKAMFGLDEVMFSYLFPPDILLGQNPIKWTEFQLHFTVNP